MSITHTLPRKSTAQLRPMNSLTSSKTGTALSSDGKEEKPTLVAGVPTQGLSLPPKPSPSAWPDTCNSLKVVPSRASITSFSRLLYRRFHEADLPVPFNIALRSSDLYSGKIEDLGPRDNGDGSQSLFMYPGQFHTQYNSNKIYLHHYLPEFLAPELQTNTEKDDIPTRMLVPGHFYLVSRNTPRPGALAESNVVHVGVAKVANRLYPMDPRLAHYDTFLVVHPPNLAIHQMTPLSLSDMTYSTEEIQARNDLINHRRGIDGMWQIRSSQGFTDNFQYEVVLIQMTFSDKLAIILVPPTSLCQDVITEINSGSDWYLGHLEKTEAHANALSKVRYMQDPHQLVLGRELLERARHIWYIRESLGL